MSLSELHRIINKFNLNNETEIKIAVKKINSYLKKNPELNVIDTKDLNCEINIPGYVFCKQNGIQKMIKKYYTPNCRSKQNSTDVIESMLNSLKQETTAYMKQLEIRINTIEECLKEIRNENENRDRVISNIIDSINDSVTSPTTKQNSWGYNSQPQHQNPLYKFLSGN